ncbi:MAG: VOC family protein [Cyanobacteria bacterium]|nr:VOC family protein [Cyanobacteriota bacterium]
MSSQDVLAQEDLGIIAIDHVTFCVKSLQQSVDFCKNVLGMHEFAYFSPETGVSGMISTVMKTGDIKFALNEGTNPESQINDFINKHDEGVQHVAIRVKDLHHTIGILKKRGMEFLTPVLEDRDDKGTLLQIFSKPIFGGMFFEFIQRNGCEGFGNGNVQTLYEAVEDNQFAKS